MISPESRLFCRLDQKPGSEREQQRLQTLQKLGLLDTESIPVFEEATQTAAHFLDAPICILGLLDRDRLWFKSAVGLSRIGLMNDLASSRQLPRQESFCTHVVDSQQILIIPNVTADSAFATSVLAQRYGIQSYLGVPLLASSGDCLGTLAIMGLSPRTFTPKEVEFLQITARWSMSEFERNSLLKQQALSVLNPPINPPMNLHAPLPLAASVPSLSFSVKANLISQMTQELRTPLTSILGMASVLSQGIHGSLSEKQKEYIAIIHNSGKDLLSLVNEIVELGSLDVGLPKGSSPDMGSPEDSNHCLNLSSVDIEMLCQQAIAILNPLAQRRDQQIQLTVEPGQRIWLLDKDKVRQMLYHLVFSVIQSSTADSMIRIHVSRKESALNLTVWMSHPWLGDGLPQAELTASSMLTCFVSSGTNGARPDLGRGSSAMEDHRDRLSFSTWKTDDADLMEYDPYLEKLSASASIDPLNLESSRQSLGLMLSCQLAEIHEGSVTIRGSVEEGYRYVIRLPQLKEGGSQLKGVRVK